MERWRGEGRKGNYWQGRMIMGKDKEEKGRRERESGRRMREEDAKMT